jgi:hypothetical protein
MLVKDLIEQLGYMDPEAEVHFQYCYGDHWSTQVAPRVDRVDPGYIKFSDYHRMHAVADEDYDLDEETGQWEEGVTRVVLIG